MKKSEATFHARKRMQQRGISKLQQQLLETFGTARLQKGGSAVLEMDRKTLTALRAAIDRLANVQLVLGESDRVITAQHCHKKIRTTQYAA